MFTRIKYEYQKGNIVLPNEAPFDGKPVLIRTNTGIVEAWWDMGTVSTDYEGNDTSSGFQWVCYDDEFQCDLEDVIEWMPIPKHDLSAC